MKWKGSFNRSLNSGDYLNANDVLMQQLGFLLATQKSDFVDMLNEAGVFASIDMNEDELLDLYIDNVEDNNELVLGSSLLINYHDNNDSSFDGDTRLNDKDVKRCYGTMKAYYSDNEDDEQFSSAIGLIGLAAKGAGALWKNRDKIKQGLKGLTGGSGSRSKRSSRQSRPQNDLRREQAQKQMLDSIIGQKQAEMKAKQQQVEDQNKTTRIALYIGGSVAVLGIIASLIYVMKKRRKK